MKTLLFHINSLLDGSIEKVLLELLQGLDPEKYKLKLCITHDLGELELLKSQVPAYVEIHYLLTEKQSETKKKKILKTITFGERIYEELIMPLVKKRMHKIKLHDLVKDADLIIDYDMTLAPYTHLFREKNKVAYCHLNLGHYWDGNRRKLNKLSNRLLRYDKVVMLCDEMKDKAAELYPELKGHLLRIYNAPDIALIVELSKQPLMGHEYLLEDGYIVSVGRLEESQKDFTMLIKAYAACVKKYNIRERLVIVGKGQSSAALEELAIEEEVGEMVMFVGYQANPYNWMANSRMFVFCSKYEGLPRVVVEALSLSCPIVATATPTGVREILMDGKCGMLVTPGDVAALSASMHTMLTNRHLQQSFRENSLDILGQFEINKMVREFEKQVVG